MMMMIMMMTLKRAGCMARSIRSDVPLPYTCMQPCLPLVNGFVDDALYGIRPKCQCFSSSM